MKNLTPVQLAIRVALVVGLFAGLMQLLIQIEHFSGWVSILLSAVLVSLISYLVFLISVKRFIYEKITPIYRYIHRRKIKHTRSTSAINLKSDIIAKVEDEVHDWDEQSQKEIKYLKELEIYRREFIGNVSHELKTPIFNIQGFILTLLEGGLEDPNINVKYLKRAEKSIDRMIKMLDQLDVMIKLDTQEIVPKMERINLIQLINEVLESQEFRASKKNIRFTFIHREESNVWILADEHKITQVLNNLIINSIKYGKKDGTTTIMLHDMEEKILVEISDDGIGIEESSIPRLFDRFYRTSEAKNQDQKGMGLGLSIVKHIIDAHNESINVSSIPGEGSTFSFTLKKA
mgnify:CR=1 FL=1